MVMCTVMALKYNSTNIQNINNIQSQDLLNENDELKQPLLSNSYPFFSDNQMPYERGLCIDNMHINDSDYDDEGQYVLIQQSNNKSHKMNQSQFNDTKEEQEDDDDIEQKYDDNPQMQILIATLKQLPNKDAVHVLLQFLHEENVKSTCTHPCNG